MVKRYWYHNLSQATLENIKKESPTTTISAQETLAINSSKSCKSGQT